MPEQELGLTGDGRIHPILSEVLTMALQPKPDPSFEDWLGGERAALDERYEYVDTMTGSTWMDRVEQ